MEITEIKHFNHLTSEIDALYHEAALRLGLSDSALSILYTICCHGDGCLLQDICKLSGISKQTINSALRKLEKEDILYLGSFGGRKKRVFLTEKGTHLAEHTVLRLLELENSIFCSWSREEQDLYFELTRRYLVSFKDKLKGL